MDPPVGEPSPAEILPLFFGREKGRFGQEVSQNRAKQPLKVGPFYTKKGNFIILSV